MGNHPQMSELADEHGMTLHYGRKEKMPEHVHEWVFNDVRNAWAVCTDLDCGEKMGPLVIACRLNATERLSAEDAIAFIEHMQSEWQGHSPLAVMLEAYASALEGE